MSHAGPSVVDAQEYHTRFQASRQEISNELQRPTISATAIKQKLADLKASLAEVSPLLPKYDQSQYANRIRELESALSAKLTGNKPARKFAFRPGGVKTASATSSPQAESQHATGDTGAQRSIAGSDPSVSTSSVPSSAPGDKESPQRASSVTISNRELDMIGPPSVARLFSPAGGYTLSLESLERCVVDLRPTPAADSHADDAEPRMLTTLHAKALKQCVLIVPPMQGSAMLSHLDDCVVVLSAQQFRMHNSSDTTVLLGVASVPIIEGCRKLRIGAYPEVLARGDQYTPSRHMEMQDFDWPQNRHSPNWAEMTGAAVQDPKWAAHAQERQFVSTDEALEWYRSIVA